jgi:hypothetical protein
MSNPILSAAYLWALSQDAGVNPDEANQAFSAVHSDEQYYWHTVATMLSTLMQDKPQGQSGKRFTLTFSMENDAFNTGSPTTEMLKIIDQVRGNVATGRYSGQVYDTNGNTVGEFLTTWRRDEPKPRDWRGRTPKRRS